ncbi:tetratricopeptide (TPR) repeat protein [Lewinella marina]|uniref:RagB/SusD family nutrient uptake outer membrane protein n=1 Tax=Neolewinella marina TaxID=438751 RepID=A0A2G0CDW4_9BACT|nr:RagB/SusD family nutrient uptake outer membrane protein [Neolewinella marina]NJB87523.1 tetratricopeptide (TPR) repeat protein [Neolewinella marina]PHK98171.1 RagB/SusD family nutrient uptake outer membrane protein [Neolewinella marina]
MKILNTFLLLGIGLLTAACSDKLEIQPFQNVSEDVALGTDATVKAVLVGAYDQLGGGDLYGGNNLRDAELLGGTGEILFVGTFNSPDEIARKQISVGNLDAEETWLESYQVINTVNNVLSALEVVDADDRARVEGEARFIRGLVYFDLLRFFAQPYEGGAANDQLGVPLILTPTRGISEENNVSRASVAAGYEQVLEDLTTAADLLPATNGIFADRYAATALLARVYLQMDRYAEARDAANTVIESGFYSLTPDYASAFMNGSNSTEDIFAMQVSSQDGVNNLTTFFSVPEFGGRDGDIEVLPAHLALYAAEDDRRDLFFERGGVTYTGKFNNQFANVTLIRLAEMYLIRAEANERLGTEVGATPTADINRLLRRAGLESRDEVDLSFILLERRRELAFEGFRIHDIKRLQGSVGNFSYDAPELVYPIPSREMVANPNLQQNTGYN